MTSSNKPASVSAGRNEYIDLLRGLAILTVMMFHHPVTLKYVKFGGISVPLFFVLSGFLVGGLVFKEIKRTGKLNVSRFVFRRGFKIWPQFYFMILIIPLLQYSAGKLTGNTFVEFNRDYLTGFKGELTMLQNYFGNIYGVTWSLAVEEHFYVLLPFAFLL